MPHPAFDRYIGIEEEIEITTLFPLLHHIVVEKAPGHGARLSRHITLSGFMRTTTFIAVAGCWGAVALWGYSEA